MKNTFLIDEPKILLTDNFRQCKETLTASRVKYRQITEDYIVFPAKLFGADTDLMVGLHGGSSKWLEFIEIFRPKEYYEVPGNDAWKSFGELSGILRRKYGPPASSGTSGMSHFDTEQWPFEKWETEEYTIDHYLIDRFGVGEYLKIHFKVRYL